MPTPRLTRLHLLPLLCLASVLFTVSCRGDQELERLLHTADSIVEDHPDSVLAMLQSHDSLFAHASLPTRMRYEVVKADANNKRSNFTATDSAFREVVDYYDRHGSPNEKTKAYYLMGCVYRDEDKHVEALESYYQAIEASDTTRKDCDYGLLECIYGAMTEIFLKQGLPDRLIEASKMYSKYALLDKDTMNWIYGYERMIAAYYLLKDTANVYRQTKETSQLYRKYGFFNSSHSVYSASIYFRVINKEYESAKQLISDYEKYSGFFDEEGNIDDDKRQYYYTKGLYYLGVNELDSAEKCFRKIPVNTLGYESYNGLFELFKAKKNSDSISKYAQMSDTSLIRRVNKIQTKGVEEVIQQHQHKSTNNHDRYKIIIAGLAFLFALLPVLFVFRKKVGVKADVMDNYELLLADSTIQQFVAQSYTISPKISEKDWEDLYASFKTNMPELNKFILGISSRKVAENSKTVDSMAKKTQNLSIAEYRTCILTFIGISPNGIRLMLDATSQSVSNFKSNANMKLFGDKSATTLRNNLLSRINHKG